MGCATSLVKYFVFLANLIFALAGLGLIILGVLFKFNYSEATKAIPTDLGLAPILSIIIGAIVFITAFLGCCGAVRESTCMLTSYAIILLTIFILQLAIGVYAFIQIKDTNEFRNTIYKSYRRTFDNRFINREANETVQVTQKLFECCGVDGPEDWSVVPATCCRNTANTCSSSSPLLYEYGCVQKINDFLIKQAKISGGVAIGIAAVEIIGAVFGLCLASSIRNHYRRNIYA